MTPSKSREKEFSMFSLTDRLRPPPLPWDRKDFRITVTTCSVSQVFDVWDSCGETGTWRPCEGSLARAGRSVPYKIRDQSWKLPEQIHSCYVIFQDSEWKTLDGGDIPEFLSEPTFWIMSVHFPRGFSPHCWTERKGHLWNPFLLLSLGRAGKSSDLQKNK